MRDLYVIGAGGFGRETAWLAERINRIAPVWRICGAAREPGGRI